MKVNNSIRQSQLSIRVEPRIPKILAVLNENGKITKGVAVPSTTSAIRYSFGQKYTEKRTASQAYEDARKLLSKSGFLKKMLPPSSILP